MAGYAISYTPGKLSAAQAGALAGSTHRGGQAHFEGLDDRSSPLTKTEKTLREERLSYDRVWDYSLRLACEWVSGLNVAVNEGPYRKADGTRVAFAGSASFAIPASQSGYKLWIDTASNALAGGTSWPADATTYVPIALIDTDGSQVTGIKDERGQLAMQVHATSTSPTGTTATTFTYDSDNAGAGASTYTVHERGTSATGNAKDGWNETDDKYEFISDDSGANYAVVRVGSIDVGGATALDANGAAKVAAAVAGDGLTHAAGVLAVNPDGATLEISSDAVRVKDAGISGAKLSDALADKLAQVSIGDASGSSPRTVTIQMLDVQGNNLAEVCYVRLRVCQDADGAALATNATIAVGGTGTLVRSETATKDLVCKTNASGTLTLTVTDAVLETVYLLADPTTRSKIMDCSDIGTVTIA